MIVARLGSLRDGRTLVKVLGFVGWGIILVGGIAGFIANPTADSQADESILVVGLAAFAVVLVVRLIVATVTWPARRTALIALTIGTALWFAGSAVLNAAVPASATTFPSPGEWLFLASYVAIAAFLARNGDPYERVGADPRSSVQISLGSSGVPETFVIDGRGMIRHQYIGPLSRANITGVMDQLKDLR